MTIGIIGGGPAGMSAALWLRQLNVDVLLVERESELGGLQRFNFLENHWVLGKKGETGPTLATSFAAHVRAVGIAPMLSTHVCSITREGDGFGLVLRSPQGSSEHFVSAIVLALGTRYREREVLGHVAELESVDPDRLIWGPYAFQDLQRYSGKRLLVVGAGDNAHEFIRLTGDTADSFILLARSQRKAQHGLRAAVDALAKRGRCEIFEQASLEKAIQSEGRLLIDIAGAERRRAEVDAIVVLAGYESNIGSLEQAFSPSLKAQLRLDEHGYLMADALGRTSCPGIYAAGDITNPAVPCVVTALAGGAVAARTVELELRRKQS